MEIKNETRMSKEEFSSMVRKANTKINPKVALSLIIALSIITLTLIILDVCIFQWKNQIYIPICAITLGVVVAFHILPKTFAKVLVKQNSQFNNGVRYNYTFKDEWFEVEGQGTGQSSVSRITYTSLYNVVEKEDFLVIYIAKTQFLLCKCNSFECDNKDEIIEKLLSYSKKNRKKNKQ